MVIPTASNYALTAILSIVMEDDQLHPVTFHFRSFSASELNYNVHNKELFTIYKAFSFDATTLKVLQLLLTLSPTTKISNILPQLSF